MIINKSRSPPGLPKQCGFAGSVAKPVNSISWALPCKRYQTQTFAHSQSLSSGGRPVLWQPRARY
jgi:hypothetical protein